MCVRCSRSSSCSGNFFLTDEWPVLIEVAAEIFPVNDALLTPLNRQTGARIEWLDLVVLLLWGVAALLVARDRSTGRRAAADREVVAAAPKDASPCALLRPKCTHDLSEGRQWLGHPVS